MARKKKIEAEAASDSPIRVKLNTSCVSFPDYVVHTDDNGYVTVPPNILTELQSLGVIVDE